MGQVRPEILGRLFDEHAPALALYARQWCGSADDAVQEAFVALAQQRTAPDQIVPWLYRVVRNAALEVARRERRRRQREAIASSGETWFAATDDHIDAQHAQMMLFELEPDVREVVVARIWGGLTFDEIARIQQCSVSTAHRRYQAGISQLYERLERPWIHQPPAREMT